jgi:DNA-binding LacI/PurR family transcriptional regulator
MNEAMLPPNRVESLAEILEDDIRRRRLRPGDRYLTAAEAGQQFAVSSMMVDRAMRKLANGELLVRHRGRGTFVGPKASQDSTASQPFDVVHLLVAMDLPDTNSFPGDEVVNAVRAALPEVAVQVHYIPAVRSDEHVRQALERLGGGSDSEGFLLIRSSRQVQSLVQDAGVNAVVYGRAYPGVRLPWIEHDQEQVGHLLGEYVLERGFRHCVLITRCQWRFGDNVMLDAFKSVLSLGQFTLKDVETRSIPLDQATINAVVEESLGRINSPTIFVCRHDAYANAALSAVARVGRTFSHDVGVVSGSSSSANNVCPYPRVVPVLSLRVQIAHAIALLCEAKEGKPLRSTVLPVAFYESNERIPTESLPFAARIT